MTGVGLACYSFGSVMDVKASAFFEEVWPQQTFFYFLLLKKQ
jgi:hypothetical protein